MTEQTAAITFKGNPLTLVGPDLAEGDKAPDAVLLTNDLNDVRLSEFLGKVVIVASVPSLDTSVCDTQTRTFNEKATSLDANVEVLTVSMDLPFAQARWCGQADVDRVRTLSDHRQADFGRKWGLLIKELRLLARAVHVVDAEGVIRYKQIVKEMTDEPDYDAALQAVQKLTGG